MAFRPLKFPGLSRNGPLAGDIVLCSWARHFTLTVPLSTRVYKWVLANLLLGVAPRCSSIPSKGKKQYSWSLHSTETGIGSGLMDHFARMQTLPLWYSYVTLWVRSFGMIRIKINDPRSFESWAIKWADEIHSGQGLIIFLMHHDPSELGSLILI